MAMAKYHFILDIGHANGTGARSLDNKHEEHNLCTRIVAEVRTMLASKGHTVTVLDFPEKNNTQDLNSTITAANALTNVACGISFHMDAAEPASAKGAHVCYYSTNGQKVATAIANKLITILPGRANKTVKRDNLAVLKKTKPTWVLVECGFITNPHDCMLAVEHPEVIAYEIVQGLLSYYV